MGLFGMGNWNKPGPGVSKDAPKPKAFFQFFVLYGRKFWKMLSLNMLYILLSIPQIAIIFCVFAYFLASLLSDSVEVLGQQSWVWAVNLIAFGLTSIWMMICGAGPTTAGFTYILRNFSEEKHAWIWSDMKEKIKENFLPGLIVFVVDVAVLILASIALIFYGQFLSGLFATFMQAFLFICVLAYMMMHWYIYTLMIGYKVKTYHLFTNAFVLVMLKLPANAGMLLLLGGVLIAYHLVSSLFWPLIVLTVIGMFTFIGFAWVFYSWRILKKNVNPDEGVMKKYEV